MFFVNPAIKYAKQLGFDQSSGEFITCGYRLLRYRRRQAFYANRTIYDPWLSGKRKRAGNERRLSPGPRSSNTCRGDGQIQTSATAIFPSRSTGNTCRGNGRIQVNAATIFSLHPADKYVPRQRADTSKCNCDLSLSLHRQHLPLQRADTG